MKPCAQMNAWFFYSEAINPNTDNDRAMLEKPKHKSLTKVHNNKSLEPLVNILCLGKVGLREQVHRKGVHDETMEMAHADSLHGTGMDPGQPRLCR